MQEVGTAVILAGGKSTRMGFDKESLVINGQRLLYALHGSLSTRFDQIIVVSNTLDVCCADGFEVVRDDLPGLGPLGGIHAGLMAAKSRYSYVLACDMPHLNMDYVSFMQSQLPPPKQEISALATAFGRHIEPFNAFYNKCLVDSIRTYADGGQRSLTGFLRAQQAVLIDEATARRFSPDWSMFANINTPEDYASMAERNESMTGVKSTRVKKIGPLESSYCDDLVVEEVPLKILVNGNNYATLMCTPSAMEYLVIGFLVSNGLIVDLSDILSLEIDQETAVAKVVLGSYVAPDERERAITSGCGKGEIYLEVIKYCPYNNSDISIPAETLLAHISRFNKMSDLFQQTGGVHSGAICSRDAILLFHEDIGRHNAVDKLIGEALSRQISLADKILLTSGRLSSEILLKAARQSIPVIVSRSAPTALAVELAARVNITLIGFARGNRMNVYAGDARVETKASDMLCY